MNIIKGIAALTRDQKASVARAVAERNAELGPPQGVFAGTDGAEAIRFALEIDDHYEMRDFLQGWMEGDTREWPEFKPVILGAPASE